MTSTRDKKDRTEVGPGDLVAIPLECGGWGVALVARQFRLTSRPPHVISTYGFDRVFDRVPALSKVQSLSILDSVHQMTGSDLAAREGRWVRIGMLPNFAAENWPRWPEAATKRGVRSASPQEQVVHVHADDFWSTAAISNKNAFVSNEEYSLLPPVRGLGDARFLEVSLDKAIRSDAPYYRFRVTPKALEVWKRIIERAKALGWYPQTPKQVASKQNSRPTSPRKTRRKTPR